MDIVRTDTTLIMNDILSELTEIRGLLQWQKTDFLKRRKQVAQEEEQDKAEAIAFQESTLGKKMPKNSHNAWGWAIYTGTNSGAKFHDWKFAIETVAKGLKTDYIDRGLNTPEAIMTRYTDSDGSWAFGVNFAIEEMTPK